MARMSRCPMCPGKGVLLGKLGARSHWRCRACGMQWSFVDSKYLSKPKKERKV